MKKIKRLLLRPSLLLWGIGLLAVIPFGKMLHLGILLQLAFLCVAIYCLILVIVYRNEITMFD